MFLKVIYYQDFPYIDTYDEEDGDSLSYFKNCNLGNDILEFLFTINVPIDIIKLVKRVNFSESSARLILSIPGVHMSNKSPLWGFKRLAKIVEPWRKEYEDSIKSCNDNVETPKLYPTLIYQSVYSSYTPMWIKEFFYSAMGRNYLDCGNRNSPNFKNYLYDHNKGFKILQRVVPSFKTQVICFSPYYNFVVLPLTLKLFLVYLSSS